MQRIRMIIAFLKREIEKTNGKTWRDEPKNLRMFGPKRRRSRQLF